MFSVSYLFSHSVHQFLRLIEEKEQKQKASSSLFFSLKKKEHYSDYLFLVGRGIDNKLL